jgi:predicted AlkP superfamily pyrophosphatase or phosphodiesterase
MSDVQNLLAAFSTGSAIRPTDQVLNLVDLSRAVASVAGVEVIEPTTGSAAIADMIGPAEHVIFVLVDGLGLNLLEKLPANSFLRRHLATELRTVFPSTTSVALTTIATCRWPAKHAVTGWWTHLPEIQSAAAILQFVKRSDRRSLSYHGVPVDQVFARPSVWSGLSRDSLVLLPERIASSVYSVYFSGGQPRRGYRSFREATDFTVDRIKGATHPTYTYLYNSRIDEEAHRCGIDRQEVQAAIADTDWQLEQLAAGLGGRGRLVVSADHGFLDADRSKRHQVRMSDPLLEYLRYPPSGDARVMYLHLKEGAEDAVRQYFRRRFGGLFWLITVDEAEAIGLFGPGCIAAPGRQRFGDVIAISRGRDVIEYRPPGNSGRIMEEAAQHSGLTPEEMRIPLIIV